MSEGDLYGKRGHADGAHQPIIVPSGQSLALTSQYRAYSRSQPMCSRVGGNKCG